MELELGLCRKNFEAPNSAMYFDTYAIQMLADFRDFYISIYTGIKV